MAKTTLNILYGNEGPSSVRSINLGSSSPNLGGTVNLTPYVNLTAFNAGNNGIRYVLGLSQLTALEKFEYGTFIGKSFNAIDGGTYLKIGEDWFDVSTADLPRSLKYLDLRTRTVLRGDVADLPPNMEYLLKISTRFDADVIKNNGPLDWAASEYGLNIGTELSGRIENFPPSLSTIRLGNWTTITGNISGLPPNLTDCVLGSLNTVFGDIKDVSRNINENFNITGRNTVTGNISTLPLSATQYVIGGSLYGTLNTIPTARVERFVFGGSNTITGNISALTLCPKLTAFEFGSGNSTIFGNISSLPAGLVTFRVTGNNTVITGNLSSLKPGLKNFYINSTKNTIQGNLSSVPNTVTDVFQILNSNTPIEGSTNSIAQCRDIRLTTNINTTSGNLDVLTPDAVSYWNDTSGHITGQLKNLPRTLQTLVVRGGATVINNGVQGVNLGTHSLSGDLSELPKNLNGYLLITGSNSSITGKISDLQKDVYYTDLWFNPQTSSVGGSIDDIKFTRLVGLNLIEGTNVTGNLASLSHLSGCSVVTPQGNTVRILQGLQAINIQGSNNTIFGNLSSIPESANYVVLISKNTVDSYYDGTGGRGYFKRKWGSLSLGNPNGAMIGLYYIPTIGANNQPRMSPSHMTTLLVDLCAATWTNRGGLFAGEPFLYLGGSTNPTISLSAYPDAALAIQSLSARFVELSGVFTPPNTVA